MLKKRINIGNIPAIAWGETNCKVFIAVHGNMSNKEDDVIKIFADKVVKRGYQLLSFDLPEHGERRNETNYACKVQNCVKDLRRIIEHTKKNYKEISIWACSMGAYFSLIAYKDEDIKQCVFLSPVVDMKFVIDNIMQWSNTTEKIFKEKKEIKTDFGQVLYWDYKYVKDHPITDWEKKTFVLYGDKDNIQSEDIINNFCSKFDCDLEILENGEHYFHTEEQLQFYEKWVDNII